MACAFGADGASRDPRMRTPRIPLSGNHRPADKDEFPRWLAPVLLSGDTLLRAGLRTLPSSISTASSLVEKGVHARQRWARRQSRHTADSATSDNGKPRNLDARALRNPAQPVILLVAFSHG
jgi:hypothetical protein